MVMRGNGGCWLWVGRMSRRFDDCAAGHKRRRRGLGDYDVGSKVGRYRLGLGNCDLGSKAGRYRLGLGNCDLGSKAGRYRLARVKMNVDAMVMIEVNQR